MSEDVSSAWAMAETANEHVECITVDEVRQEMTESDVTLLDIRDIRECWIEGSIPGAKQAPRGMLEFWADPKTDYHRDYFDPKQRYILFCNEAGRSALAAKRLQEMGYEDVAHLEGGFTAWKESGEEFEDVEQRDYKNR